MLRDRTEIEPLLRRSADLVLETTAPPAEVADSVLAHVAAIGASGSEGVDDADG